jgi:hypothetical protein
MNLVCTRRRRAAKGPAKPSARGAGWGRRSPVVALGLWESERAHAAEREQENQTSFRCKNMGICVSLKQTSSVAQTSRLSVRCNGTQQ